MLVATAGHVDHGKTSLIRQLTGVDTDRLDEEKRRGLSIELGFAFQEVQENTAIGFIDVPGHQRFLNTMIAGINNIDIGMIVIAADDGPMPQTFEHLQILRLLGVNNFVVVISKIDRTNAEAIQKVSAQVKKITPNATIFKISNQTGEGIQSLKEFLQHSAINCPARKTERQFRLHIDRVFSKKGTGLIATGTSFTGEVKIGDELHLHSFSNGAIKHHAVKVRTLHAQGKTVGLSQAGQRCALNLSGRISSEDIHRGDQLCASNDALPSVRMDAEFYPADGTARQLKHLGQIKLYIGTRRIQAKTYLLKIDEEVTSLKRKHRQLVQLILSEPIVAFSGDRFVIRDDNEREILGGGCVIDPEAPQWGKTKTERMRTISALIQRDPKRALDEILFRNDDIVDFNRCKRIWNLTDDELNQLLNDPLFSEEGIERITVDNQPFVIAKLLLSERRNLLVQALIDWHTNRPMEPGIKVSKLKSLLANEIPAAQFGSILSRCIASGEVVTKNNLVHALGHRPTISKKVQQDWLRLEKYMTERGLSLPLRSEIQSQLNFDAKYLEALVRTELKSGQLYVIGEKRLALPATLRQLALIILNLFKVDGGFSTIEAKSAFGLGRNLTVEILEFFDAIGYTKRDAELRIIANIDAEVGGNKLFSQ